ncbi:MAG: BrnT family toxin [Rhodospirillales bacterium]|nr:BrnT family toxin [Rhodospirillales bacterium]
MPEAYAEFDWDEANLGKCHRHGITAAEIEDLLRANPRIAPDPKHSATEQRFIAVGRNAAGRPVFVAFTTRRIAGRLLVRPISARYMHAKEIARYEAESS